MVDEELSNELLSKLKDEILKVKYIVKYQRISPLLF